MLTPDASESEVKIYFTEAQLSTSVTQLLMLCILVPLQLKVQIQSLTSKLGEEREEMQTFSARIQDIQAALNS